MKAFVFTGQGSEYKGMAKELYENNTFAKEFIDNLDLNFDFKKIYIEDNDLIHDTRYSQIGIFIISTILSKLLEEKGISADATIGLSLGEYTALCYAKSISVEDTIKVLENRSRIMYEALNGKDTGMMAVLFFDKDKLEKIVKDYDKVWIANYNSPDQIVISGDNTQLEDCSKKCSECGAKRIVKLDVMGAFHSGLLKEASTEFESVLNEYNFKEPSIPVYFNYLGNKSNANIKELLTNQLYNSVKFEQSIINMINDGIDEFYLVGVGNALDSFIRSIGLKNKVKLKIIHIEKLKDLEALNE